MAFAGAPVQPVGRRLGKSQCGAEGFDLLPFAPWHVDIQTMASGLKGVRGELIHSSEAQRVSGQLWKRCGRGQVVGLVVTGFSFGQRTLAQPLG